MVSPILKGWYNNTKIPANKLAKASLLARVNAIPEIPRLATKAETFTPAEPSAVISPSTKIAARVKVSKTKNTGCFCAGFLSLIRWISLIANLARTQNTINITMAIMTPGKAVTTCFIISLNIKVIL